MKVRLCNFKCYESQEFNIPDQGLVLISAPSGSGKSTLLEAILFALFGSRKSMSSWGKKGCKVEVEFRNFLITRTKVPNRLIIKLRDKKEVYEDDAAQELINREFGETFQTTSFMDQYSLHKSFLLMSPPEKLAFLEKFAFQDVDLHDIKEKAKEKIKQTSQELTSVHGKIETAREILESFSLPAPVPFPLKGGRSRAAEEKLIKNESVRCKNTKVYISRAEKEIRLAEVRLRKLELYWSRKGKIDEDIIHATREIEGLTKKQGMLDCMDDEEIEKLSEKLERKIRDRDLLSFKKDVENLEEKLKSIEKREKDLWIQNIKTLKQKTTQNPIELGNLIAKLCQQKNKAAEYEKFTEELKKYDDVEEDDLETFKEELIKSQDLLELKKEQLHKLELSQTALKCPKCQCSLLLKQDPPVLVPFNIEISLSLGSKEEIAKDIENIKQKLEFIQKTIIEDSKKLETKKGLQKSLDGLKEFFAKQGVEQINLKKTEEQIQTNTNLLNALNADLDKLQDLESRLRNDRFSDGTLSMRKELQQMKEELSRKGEVEEIEENEEELREKITVQKVAAKEYDMLQERIEGLQEKLAARRSELEKISADVDTSLKVADVENKLVELRAKLEELKEKLAVHEQNLEKIGRYKVYVEEKERYDSLTEKVKNLDLEEKEIQAGLSAAELFRQKVLESESVAIHNVIDSINKFASSYLEMFFPEDQISVTLLTFKEAKNKKSEKPQINLQIINKNNECDFSDLSGGEKSRVVLAYTLALGEMFQTPALLLDECTAGLDSENTQNVFESIKENFSDRLILAVAHQVVEGSYDYVIKL